MAKNKIFKKYGSLIMVGIIILAAIFILPQLNKESKVGAQKELTGTGLSMTFYDESGRVIGTDIAIPAASIDI